LDGLETHSKDARQPFSWELICICLLNSLYITGL